MVSYGFIHHFIRVAAGFCDGVCGAAILGAGTDGSGYHRFGPDQGHSSLCEPPYSIGKGGELLWLIGCTVGAVSSRCRWWGW